MSTQQLDEQLPSLPVPPLHDALDLLVRAVQAHTRAEDMRTLRELVDEAKKPGSVVSVLHGELVELATKSRNWLEAWWFKHAYLKWRCPAPLNVNFHLTFDVEACSTRLSQIAQATRLITGCLRYYDVIRRGELAVERMAPATPLTMDQWSKLFTTCRIPLRDVDTFRVASPPSRSIVVVHRKHFFEVEVLDEARVTRSPQEIAALLAQCVELVRSGRCSAPPPAHTVGALTAGDRDLWADAREALVGYSQANADVLRRIEDSLFVVVLEDAAPETEDELARVVLGGDAENRFFDKVFQLIVCRNGRAGLNGEHTPMEAPVPAKMCDFALDLPESDFASLDAAGAADAAARAAHAERLATLPAVQELALRFPPAAAELAARCAREWQVLESSVRLRILRFSEYGHDWVKQRAHMSPDTFVQLAMQWAVFRLHGEFFATYETGQIRQFYHGRTETVRSCLPEVAEWCHAMKALQRELSASAAAAASSASAAATAAVELMQRAANAHREYMMRAVRFMACDRVMLGMRVRAAETGRPEPELFRTRAFADAVTFRLSTSNMSQRHLVAGFMAVTGNGYGVCYGTRGASLQFSVASWAGDAAGDVDAAAMHASIAESLCEIRTLIDSVGGAAAGALLAHPVAASALAGATPFSSAVGSLTSAEGVPPPPPLSPVGAVAPDATAAQQRLLQVAVEARALSSSDHATLSPSGAMASSAPPRTSSPTPPSQSRL